MVMYNAFSHSHSAFIYSSHCKEAKVAREQIHSAGCIYEEPCCSRGFKMPLQCIGCAACTAASLSISCAGIRLQQTPVQRAEVLNFYVLGRQRVQETCDPFCQRRNSQISSLNVRNSLFEGGCTKKHLLCQILNVSFPALAEGV